VLQLLALGSTFIVFHHTGGYALMAVGQVKIQAIMTWVEGALFAVLALAMISQASPSEVAAARMLTVLSITWIYGWLLTQGALGLKPKQLLGSFARPLASSLLMAATLFAFPWPANTPLLASLLVKVIMGGCIYAGAVAAFWKMSGMPDGAERYLWSKCREAFKKGSRKSR
jgi:O-antigen/teichoic acid export membrane protein